MKKPIVYVLTNAAWPDWVKIGRTEQKLTRLQTYNICSPFRDFEFAFEIECEKDSLLENLAHTELSKSYERKNEWFKCPALTAAQILKDCHDKLLDSTFVSKNEGSLREYDDRQAFYERCAEGWIL